MSESGKRLLDAAKEMRAMVQVPNPGSADAIALSCECPVLDNRHGIGDGPWWITEGCPVHAPRADADADESEGTKR